MNNSIVWLTGVSAAGKTTVANELAQLVRHRHELAFEFKGCVRVDADVVRKNMWPDLGYTVEDRRENVLRIGRLSTILATQLEEHLIVVACIAPNLITRSEAFQMVADQCAYSCMVFLHCPLEERIERDPKGLYAKAMDGEIQGLTGYDGDYDLPLADLSFNTAEWTPNQIATKILQLV